MNENSLAQVMTSVAQRLRADFTQSQLFKHRGEAGGNRELLVRQFLESQLPGHQQAVHSAEIVAASGDVSPQCDIVVCDTAAPPLTDMEGYRIVFNECVYGVLEVKTKLTKEQLFDACDKIAAVKRLPKTAYHLQSPAVRISRAYGKNYPYVPTAGMIFAFDSLELATLGDHLLDWCQDHPVEEWPDSIWILGKGYLAWTNPDSGFVNPTPEPTSSLLAFEPWHDEDVLLPFALHLNSLFGTAWMPPLRLTDYAGQHPLGVVARVWQRKPDAETPSSD